MDLFACFDLLNLAVVLSVATVASERSHSTEMIVSQ